MKTVYTIHGSEDGVFSVASSWKKAEAIALKYCGPNSEETFVDYSSFPSSFTPDTKDRMWDVRHYQGDNAAATVDRMYVE